MESNLNCIKLLRIIQEQVNQLKYHSITLQLYSLILRLTQLSILVYLSMYLYRKTILQLLFERQSDEDKRTRALKIDKQGFKFGLTVCLFCGFQESFNLSDTTSLHIISIVLFII